MYGPAGDEHVAGWEEVYPGWGGTGVVWEGCYTGTPPVPSRDPYLVNLKAKAPTHGQMKAILSTLMRFPRMGLEWVPE